MAAMRSYRVVVTVADGASAAGAIPPVSTWSKLVVMDFPLSRSSPVLCARRQASEGNGYWDGAYRPWCPARGVERLMTRCSRWGAPTHRPAPVECACDRVSTSWRKAGIGVPALLAHASTSVASRMLIVCAFLLGGYV